MANHREIISTGWQIRQWSPDEAIDFEAFDDATWYATEMPRQVHEILVSHGVIEDPCLPGGRLKECLWVAECDWIYRCHFEANPRAALSYLTFPGLDTIADVYLNGAEIASHSDMFLPLTVSVSDRVKAENELVIHFHSPHKWISRQEIPGPWEGKFPPSKMLRKPHHDFSDYLGGKPYFTNIGAYDDVILEQADAAMIRAVEVDISMDDLSRGRVSIEVTGAGSTKNVRVEAALMTLVEASITATIASVSQSVVQDGANGWSTTLEISVDQPELWWPRGYGEQTLHKLSVDLSVAGEVCQTATREVGFRKLHIDEKLMCAVNGKTLRLWGANLAPITGWTHRWMGDKVKAILDRVELANMNCLRIWGGGERYADELYEEADRRGILLWHDFPNEYGPCPDTQEYFNQCRGEAEYLVTRLRHHPSIMLWCGGNEAHMGNAFSGTHDDLIGKGLYEEIYPDVCRRIDPGRYYHVNSPIGGAYPNDPTAGDTHNYTTTWYVPGIQYPVFTTENMRVSAPPLRSMNRYVGEDQVWPAGYDGRMTASADLPWPESWERRSSANSLRKIPAIEEYLDPTDGESLIYTYGAAHGRYLRTSVEAHRRGRPSGHSSLPRISQGHLVWKLNATWPHLYSNILDYYLEPYIPYYEVKRAYEPILLSFDIGDHLWLWMVNDTAAPISGSYRAVLFNMRSNEMINELVGPAAIQAGESGELTDLDGFGQFDEECILYAELLDSDGTQITRSIDYVCKERYLRFPETDLRLEAEDGELRITSERFARCVELRGDNDGDEFGWLFSDNYFDLMPWETKTVHIHGAHPQGIVTAQARNSGAIVSVEVT